MAASNSEAGMKKEELAETMEQQQLHRRNQSEVNENENENENDDESHPPLSAQSSPPHSLSDNKDPSPPLHSPSNSSDFSDHTCQTHGNSSIDDALSITRLEDLPPSAYPPSPRPVAANRAQPTEPIVVTKVDAEIQGVRKVEEGSASDVEPSDGDGGAVGRGRKLMANLSMKKIKREELRKKILLGFRIVGFVFCLASFSVMASDKNQGWALDSFYRYKEFRYCMAVNVIGFVYSALQSYDLVYFLSTGKHMIRNYFKQYFDFFIDQIVAYLLLSASSSAATRVDDWQSNWGKDKFPDMAITSVGLSIVAFVAFALSCIISGYTLCKSA
ncbi:CASP-like protein 4A1 [Cucurbita pepo subsp. pepo]|uniref:CASP-like protein 4A1 n=1 Tax=Cucurbita pepo subsp. pepo TaxID=3664 RepID=UPI000C9D55A8|nr:CASP-like protein 4A1 [Cucurbita pepo subsp. pepo]XP_023550771.1 CASP-like protein 4A1 [Cucurbita pepo subsp. pepo]